MAGTWLTYAAFVLVFEEIVVALVFALVAVTLASELIGPLRSR